MYFDIKCKHLEFLMLVLNVGETKFGNTRLILPTTKFSSTPIFPTIWYLNLIIIADA